MSSDKTRFGLDETRSRGLVQHHPRPQEPSRRRLERSRPTAPSSGRTRSASGSPRSSRWSASSRRCRRDRYIDIPGAVIDIYKTYRPSPLLRARQLERVLGLPAGREDLLQVRGRQPGGLAQAQHRDPAGLLQQAGGHHQDLDRDRRRPVGQRAVHRRRAVRHRRRGLHGQGQLRAEAVPPHPHGDLRRARSTRRRPTSPTPAVTCWPWTPTRPARSASRSPRPSRSRSKNPDTHYSLGSVLNHVCLHQTIIGQEAIAQMEIAEDEPDVVIGCVGGGSNFAGHRVPVLPAASSRARATRVWSPSSRRRARRSPPASTATTSATRRA